MNKHFIPEADAAFDSWQNNLVDKVASRAPALNIPLDAVAKVQTAQTRWKTAYAIAKDPATRTKGAVKEKQEAREAYEAVLREFIRSYLTYNLQLTDQGREDIGLPVHKKTHTDAPVADKAPYVAVSGDGPRRVRFDFGATKDSAAKPDGQHGAEFASVISDAKPTEIEDLTRSSFDTHTPLILNFKESERGKILWLAARWENTAGQKGPWGEIQSAIIP